MFARPTGADNVNVIHRFCLCGGLHRDQLRAVSADSDRE